MYAKFLKRFLDLLLAAVALTILSPVLLVLIAVGAIVMRGNPFFVQPRPGKRDKNGDEKIFNLIKFRSMDNRRDKNGNLLPDEVRLNGYGKLIRKTSLDELPELFNILIGDMSIVGPRPLLVEYLPYYKASERHRHDVRPGLTGWAQINGRNNIKSWEERFEYDIEYVNRCSFAFDIKVLFMTVFKVAKRSDVLVGSQIKAGRLDVARRAEAVNEGIYQEV